MRFFGTVAMTMAALAAPVQPVLAADAAGGKARQVQPQPLRPGKTAGVHNAQTVRGGLALVGAGGIIALVALAASSGGGSGGGGDTGQPNMQTMPATTTS